MFFIVLPSPCGSVGTSCFVVFVYPLKARRLPRLRESLETLNCYSSGVLFASLALSASAFTPIRCNMRANAKSQPLLTAFAISG